MKSIAGILLVLGAGSALLNTVGFEFKYLFWIDMFGEQTGWMIRIGMMLAGIAIFGVLKYIELKEAVEEIKAESDYN